VISEFFSQSATASSSWVDGIINGDLTILMIQPGVDVLSALLEDLLAEHLRSRGRIGIEVIFRNLTTGHRSTAVVTEVEDSRLHAQPD